MLRCIIGLVLTIVAYFVLVLIVGTIAAAQVGLENPENPADGAYAAKYRAVNTGMPLIIFGAVTLGVVGALILPLGKSREEQLPPAQGGMPDGWQDQVVSAGNPLKHFVGPIVFFVLLGSVSLGGFMMLGGRRGIIDMRNKLNPYSNSTNTLYSPSPGPSWSPGTGRPSLAPGFKPVSPGVPQAPAKGSTSSTTSNR